MFECHDSSTAGHKGFPGVVLLQHVYITNYTNLVSTFVYTPYQTFALNVLISYV